MSEGGDEERELPGRTDPDQPWERDDPTWPVRDVETVWETPYFEAGYDVVETPAGDTFVADGLEPGDADPDDSEFIDVRTIPVEEAVATLRGQGPTNGLALVALSLAREEDLW